MFVQVTAKNVRGVFYETQCSISSFMFVFFMHTIKPIITKLTANPFSFKKD